MDYKIFQVVMMSKTDIDEEYINLFPKLRPLIRAIAFKQKRQIEEDMVLNETYIHLAAITGITTVNMLEAIVVNFINKNLAWGHSNINRRERILDINETKSNNIKDEPFDPDEYLQDKIELEIWYTEKHVVLQMFHHQADRLMKAIFETYFIRGYTKGKDMAKFLNINQTYAQQYIKQMKNEIRAFNDRFTNEI